METWNTMVIDAELQNYQEGAIAFKNYVYTTWISDTARFPKSIWNHYDNSGSRTNNHLEGLHNGLNLDVGKHNPRLFLLIYVLKKRNDIYEKELRDLELGANPQPQRAKYRKLDERITNLKNNFADGDNSIYHYLDSISSCIIAARNTN